MNRQERVLAALNHKEPDKIPIDFGGTATSGIHVSCVAALREHYGLPRRLVKVHEPYQMLGWIDDDLAEAIGIDVAAVIGPNTMFGFPNTNWRSWKAPFGLEVLVSEHFKTTVDAKGDVFIYPQGDTSAPPSGRMPDGGYFFDTIVRQEPIDEDKLDPRDNLEEFGPVSEADLAHFDGEVRQASATGRAVIATFGGLAFGDIALVPAPFLKHPKGIRDVEEWYVSTVIRKDYVLEVFERQCEIAEKNVQTLIDLFGDRVQAVMITGTDFGTQRGPFISNESYRELFSPFHKRINSLIHGKSNWKTFTHSCGSIYPLIPEFIADGFDILNPVQCSAAEMDALRLKNEFGRDLVFWGGGVNTQQTIAFGTPAEVYDEVRERIEVFNEGGGFVFNAIHNIQGNVPIENVLAMFRALRDSGN
jgi:hypothetical protein